MKIRKIIFLTGFLLCMLPLLCSSYESFLQNKMISTYFSQIEENETLDIQKEMEKAHQYNEQLLYGKETNYNQILWFGENGMIAQIKIPSISVSLPIYHGVSEDVLSIGVGHLPSSSFPVGGLQTHAILTGHTGLAKSKLFTRLDELETGDCFYIYVGNDVLAYEVENIQVILPEQLDCLTIQNNRDLVSLVTCTPYGINSHRLVVTGKRIPYSKSQEENIEKKSTSFREFCFVFIPILIFISYVIKEKYHEKHH
ncbi:class C sortase [Floccifex sp.]|uniref:class C sortase n=1 Tax=Floccifex sp. TaxID=2815810 RepID=UPI003F052377